MSHVSKESISHITILDEDAGQRLDNFLLRILKGVPKSHIYRIIRSGEVRINKSRAKPESRIQTDDQIRIPPIRLAAKSASPADKNAAPAKTFQILFEDDDFLALNKPAGLAVHGGSGVNFGVIEALRAARAQARYLELVHRLDRDTSGILLIAKRRSALRAIHQQMRAGQIDKRYLTLVKGDYEASMRDVRFPLYKFLLDNGERRVRVDAAGKDSHTRFFLKSRHEILGEVAVLLEAQLKTGRTHQIRVHVQACGKSMAGDEKYGDFAWNRALQKLGLKRMFLHAASLKLTHPKTQTPLHIQAPLPPELTRFLNAQKRL